MNGLFPNRDRPFFFFDFSTGPTIRMLDGGLGGVGFGCSSFFGGSYVSCFLLPNIFFKSSSSSSDISKPLFAGKLESARSSSYPNWFLNFSSYFFSSSIYSFSKFSMSSLGIGGATSPLRSILKFIPLKKL